MVLQANIKIYNNLEKILKKICYIYYTMNDSAYQRQRSTDSSKDHKVTAFINGLFKKRRRGALTSEDIRKIKDQFNDNEMIDYIQEEFLQRQSIIQKGAKKFANQINERYGDRQYPLHTLLKKALKYKNHYQLSNEEFEEFRRLYQNSLYGSEKSNEISFNAPRTKMSKLLNTSAYPYEVSEGINLKEKDYSVMQEIIKTFKATQINHRNVATQSYTYQDCSPEAMLGEYNDKFNPMCHVHPCIAALFLPKFKDVDNHMLMTNIAHIFKCKHQGKPILNQADNNLLFHFVTDPNDMVCSERSAIEDVRARVNIQVNLWNSVFALRNGKYYDCNFTEFVNSITSCKLDSIDSPDIMQSGEEGMVMRTLFNAFSYRPTVMSSLTVMPVPVNNALSNITNTDIPSVYTVHMVVLRIPPSLESNEPINLSDSLSQPQYIVENGALVPKVTDIVYSQGIIAFYVNRRYQNMNLYGELFPGNTRWNNTPSVFSSMQKINTKRVTYAPTLTIRNDTYRLRSCVVADTQRIDNNDEVITGCSAIIITQDNTFCYYNPKDANRIYQAGSGTDPNLRNQPITQLTDDTYITDRIEKNGTIFIYENTNNVDDPAQNIQSYFNASYRM